MEGISVRHALRSALLALLLLVATLPTAATVFGASQSVMQSTPLATGSLSPNGLTDPGAP